MIALPPMTSLVAFAEAARTLSFKQAARVLHLSPSALSRQIQTLEDHLGEALFERTNPGLVLTEAGARYLAVVETCLTALRDAQVRPRVPPFEQPLRVSALESFSETWLVPRLGTLARAYPGLTLAIEATLRYADFERDKVDVAIRFGEGRWGDLYAEPLLPLDFYAVASPLLLAGEPRLARPDDLAHHTLIHVAQTPDAWPKYLHVLGVPEIAHRGDLWFDHVALALSAAESGLGVALTPDLLGGRRLREGRIVRVFPESVRWPATYHFVCRPSALSDPRVSALRDFLRSELTAEPER